MSLFGANRNPNRRRPLWLVVASSVVLGAGLLPAQASAAAAATTAPVSPAVYAGIDAGTSTGFFVYMKDRADLSTAKSAPAASKAQRVYTELTAVADRSQAPVRQLLADQKANFKPFWISNVIWVDGDKSLVDTLAKRPEVLKIEPAGSKTVVEPTAGTAQATVDAVEWGVANIKAPDVWSTYGDHGEGIVVASIDTGVQFDHPALVNQYRGNLGNGTFNHNYNWFDPSAVCPSPAPCDNHDHGTHTMGTMVGSDGGANQIGVAPGAKWISAKGCENLPGLPCSDTALLASGQWIVAPTDLNGNNPRPDLAPDIVNNSWGGTGGDTWYVDTVDAWISAGIFPMFSNGNSGPSCGTSGSPGDYSQSYSAGAYDINNTIASFSSRGPSAFGGGMKPNIAAPGVNVRSSFPGNTYGAFNGTSMASPHVAGTIALIWSAAPALRGDIAATKALLDSTATDVDATGCGGTAADNNIFGEGRLNAFAAVTAAPRGPSGTVSGKVTDSGTGSPIAGASVSSNGRTATSAPDGTYSLTLSAGDQSVTASKYGYHEQTVTVAVTDGGTTVQNFALVSAPDVTVTGKVTDGSGHGWPLYARINIQGRAVPVYTDPFTGTYSVTVPGNTTHTFTTTALLPGYKVVAIDVTLAAADKVANIAVPVDQACTAAGYAVNFSAPMLHETFDTTNTPAGWSIVNHNAGPATWAFNDPGNRGNLTGGSGGFAIMDSDKAGSGKTEDTSLVTPVLDLSGTSSPYLRFNSDYRGFSNGFADIDVSTDAGATWTNVWHQTSTSRRGPLQELVSLPGLAGAATAQVRFHYKGTFAWWWEVDNVELVDRACLPVPGGLVSGLVTDFNTGTGLVGGKVTSVDVPAESATTQATPNDPALGDGYYWLFSSATGSHPFSASKSPYVSLTKSATVAANDLTRIDYALKAARITVAPTSVQSFQPYGSARKTTLTVTNTGSAAATVDMLERNGGFSILSQTGAARVEQKVPGGKASIAARGVMQAAPPSRSSTSSATDAWSAIAGYPAAVFDNSAATLGGKLYSFGGGIDTGMENRAFMYDPAVNAWSPLPNMPRGRTKPQVAATNGKLYVLGGWSAAGAPVTAVDVYDPAAGTWSTPAATNPAARAAAGVGVVNGKVYLIGGCVDDQCTPSNNNVVFDPSSGAFSTGAAYPQDVAWGSCGGIGTRVYCAGGSGSADFSNGFAFNPASNSWSPIADMPLDLWGSAGSAAGGLLVMVGGVTAGSTAITNRTVAYDPASNTWSDGPNALSAVYRGAGSCGAYKVGGSPSPFVGSANSEVLAGLEQCDETSDVPWLATDPSSFTLDPGKSRVIAVTLTATAATGVDQPGKYTGQLSLRTETPYSVPSISVEMNVSPPPSWGKLQGHVLGAACSGNVGVKAIIRLNLSNGTGVTLHADSSGAYAWWLPKGTYQAIVAKDGWVPEAITVKVEAGIVKTQDFLLDPDPPCPSGV